MNAPPARPPISFACTLILILATLAPGSRISSAGTPGAPSTSSTRQAPGPVAASSTPKLRVDFMDVGHGDAILITSPTGKTVLIDGGLSPSGDTVGAFIRSRTQAPLDLVLLTHRHADHLGGLGSVIERQGARLFMDAAFPHPSPAYARLLRILEARHIPVRDAQRGRVIDLGGGAQMVLLTPPHPLITGSRSDANANSTVARLEFGRTRVLLTGDAEAVTETWLLDSKTDLRADVLKLPHHGSKYSSTSRFLQAVRPQIAIASSGPQTAVGHIHAQTVARVQRLGARLYRTDLDGHITVVSDGRKVTVETQRSSLPTLMQAQR